MSREMATAQRGAGAPLGMRRLRGMQVPRRRSLASPPLADPASRVPRPTLRGAPREAGMRPAAIVAGRRQDGVLILLGLTEASGMSSMKRR
jgi:hypothetical protein